MPCKHLRLGHPPRRVNFCGIGLLSDCRETRDVFQLGDTTTRTHSTEKPAAKEANARKIEFTAKILRFSSILVVLYLATAQLSPLAPDSIIAAITLGTRLCL